MRIGGDACWLLLCKVHTRQVCVVGFLQSQPFKSERILMQLQKVLSSASSPSNINGIAVMGQRVSLCFHAHRFTIVKLFIIDILKMKPEYFQQRINNMASAILVYLLSKEKAALTGPGVLDFTPKAATIIQNTNNCRQILWMIARSPSAGRLQ